MRVLNIRVICNQKLEFPPAPFFFNESFLLAANVGNNVSYCWGRFTGQINSCKRNCKKC